MSRCRTYRFLLQPTSRQRSGLERLCLGQCELYNAALEERRGAWAWERRSVSYVDQCRTLTETRAVRPDLLECGVAVCRGTLMRTVSELAKRLGLVAVAEGVETPVLARDMAVLGYDVLQGFYAARPMPADELLGFARDHAAQRMGASGDLTRR
jgi:hypothetical protein